MTIFYDSHGDAYTPCHADHPEAVAFGPAYIARRALSAPTWAEAKERGLIATDDVTGFDFLVGA